MRGGAPVVQAAGGRVQRDRLAADCVAGGISHEVTEAPLQGVAT